MNPFRRLRPGGALRPLLVAAVLGVFPAPVSGQLLRPESGGSEANSATSYGEESISDVDPLGRSTRWIDPAQAGDLMRDRVVRTRPMTPAEAAVAAMNPASAFAGAPRGYAYRAPGVRAVFRRPAYIAWTLDGPKVNAAPAYEGGFREIIPPDTVFELTLPPVPTAELTAFSSSMRVDRRLPLAVPVGVQGEPADPVAADAAPPGRFQPWIRVRVDADGRARLEEAPAAESTEP